MWSAMTHSLLIPVPGPEAVDSQYGWSASTNTRKSCNSNTFDFPSKAVVIRSTPITVSSKGVINGLKTPVNSS